MIRPPRSFEGPPLRYWGPMRIVVAIAVVAAIIVAGLRLMSWAG